MLTFSFDNLEMNARNTAPSSSAGVARDWILDAHWLKRSDVTLDLKTRVVSDFEDWACQLFDVSS